VGRFAWVNTPRGTEGRAYDSMMSPVNAQTRPRAMPVCELRLESEPTPGHLHWKDPTARSLSLCDGVRRATVHPGSPASPPGLTRPRCAAFVVHSGRGTGSGNDVGGAADVSVDGRRLLQGAASRAQGGDTGAGHGRGAGRMDRAHRTPSVPRRCVLLFQQTRASLSAETLLPPTATAPPSGRLLTRILEHPTDDGHGYV
jgi:hypothetical protein